MLMAVRHAITMVGLIGVVFYQNAKLAVLAVIVLPLAVYPLIWFGKKMRKYGRRNQSKLADITSILQEVLSGIRVVKAFATEKKEVEHFGKENQSLVQIGLKQIRISELSSPAMELIGTLGICTIVLIGGREVIAGNMTPGSFFSFGAALMILYESIKSFNNANQEIQRALAVAERVFGLLDNADIMIEQGGNAMYSPPFASLDFDKVTFAYPDGTIALSDISLTVRAGERIALVGPSGAGKTTFANLVPRFYDPGEGVIRLNGIALPEYSLPSLRRQIAVVSQDTFLFNMAVSGNVAYGMNKPDTAKVEEAARAAFAHDFILELPQAYDTIIGERGVKLSGGQRQRISIARALLKDAPLLILDEATSALDSKAERIVQLALDNLMQHRTSIVIAHRLSTILSSDRILVLDRSRILAQGTHQELLVSCDLYANLCAMQFSQKTSVEKMESA
jgi:subfamily B ATP-binding cassette protein MsbA